jgi:hypothetical protein
MEMCMSTGFWFSFNILKMTPVDMHTSIMCINILQNIKTVGGASRTHHAPFMQLVRK